MIAIMHTFLKELSLIKQTFLRIINKTWLAKILQKIGKFKNLKVSSVEIWWHSRIGSWSTKSKTFTKHLNTPNSLALLPDDVPVVVTFR